MDLPNPGIEPVSLALQVDSIVLKMTLVTGQMGVGGAVARVGEGVEEFGLPLPQLRDRGKIDGD